MSCGSAESSVIVDLFWVFWIRAVLVQVVSLANSCKYDCIYAGNVFVVLRKTVLSKKKKKNPYRDIPTFYIVTALQKSFISYRL